MRQLVYTMFISNNHPSFHLRWKENLVKHGKVSKYYETGCWFWVGIFYTHAFFILHSFPHFGAFVTQMRAGIPHLGFSSMSVLIEFSLSATAWSWTNYVLVTDVGCCCCCCCSSLEAFHFRPTWLCHCHPMLVLSGCFWHTGSF